MAQIDTHRPRGALRQINRVTIAINARPWKMVSAAEGEDLAAPAQQRAST